MMAEGLLKRYTRAQSTFRRRIVVAAGCAFTAVGFYLHIGFVKGLGIGLLLVALVHVLLTGSRR